MASYSKDPVWADVTPIQQDEGPDPVCPIAYTDAFRETMDYFRAVLHKDERSQRALDLTKHVIELGPANYTAWYFRRLCLNALEKVDWSAELDFCDSLSLAHQKNYQVWYHRQQVVSHLGSSCSERDMSHCARMLEEDSKNYHVWSYRQWACIHHQCLTLELEHAQQCIAKDVRNNSAWNQHFFVGCKLGWWRDQSKCVSEVEWCLKEAKRAPSNESPWLYLEGMWREGALSNEVLPRERLWDLSRQWMLCTPVRALLVQLLQKEGDLEQAAQICDECANSVDTTRSKYWKFKAKQIRDKKK